MNRKIILLPLALSALVLAGCGETGTSSTSSSEETPTSSETTSSSEEVPSSSSTTESETSNPEEETWSTIADLKTMDIGASFTARAYWMGTCGMINEQYGTYNTSYVADGTNGYIIYRAEAAKIDALELEVGKTVVEFTGTIANYVDEDSGSTTYECSLNTIAVVDDATGLEAPVMLTLDADNPTFTFDATTASRRVVINDAKVVSNETGNYDNVTVTFTVGTDDTEYTIFFDSRYTDTSLVAELEAGDTFNCESFVGRSRFESIDKLEITAKGGSTEEPDPEPEPLPTPISDIVESKTAVTTRGQVVAKSKQAVIIHDGTAGLYIYGRDYPGTVNVGDYVEAVGSISSYNGLLQMAWNGTVAATITKVSGEIEGTIPAPTALTAEIANGWTTNTLTQEDVKAYSWRATAGTAGEFTTLNIDGCEADIEPVYHDFEAIPLETGKTYDVTAYFVGFHNYISILVTAAEEVAGEPDPEPEPLPTPVDTTIAEALTGELSKTTLYRVTGIIEQMKGDEYGNAMLTDPETGDYITVYGNTTSMSAFTVTNGEVSYTNPKDAKTTLADIHDGDKITVLCVYDYFEKTDTHELLCVTTEHAPYEGTVDIKLPTALEHGSVTATKTEAAWGEEITLTVTPDENYVINSVKVDHGYASETLIEAPYTFTARSINEVTVELRDTSVVAESLTITPEDVPAKYDSEQMFTVDGIVFKSNNLGGTYGNGIQTKVGAYIYNETALPSAIESIVFTFHDKQESVKSGDSVNFGTSAMTEEGEANNLVKWTSGTPTVTVDCDVEGATFFRIDHTQSGAIYLSSIVINYVA